MSGGIIKVMAAVCVVGVVVVVVSDGSQFPGPKVRKLVWFARTGK